MNVVYLMGRLGSDPQIRTTKSGKQVGEISLATSKKSKSRDPNAPPEEKTTWHRVVGFTYNAQKMANLRKGEMIFVQGEIQVEQWHDQQGQTRTSVKIYAQQLKRVAQIPDGRQYSDQAAQGAQGSHYTGGPQYQPGELPYTEEDVPF